MPRSPGPSPPPAQPDSAGGGHVGGHHSPALRCPDWADKCRQKVGLGADTLLPWLCDSLGVGQAACSARVAESKLSSSRLS